MFDKFAFLCRFTKNSCRLVTIQKVIENNKFKYYSKKTLYNTQRSDAFHLSLDFVKIFQSIYLLTGIVKLMKNL